MSRMSLTYASLLIATGFNPACSGRSGNAGSASTEGGTAGTASSGGASTAASVGTRSTQPDETSSGGSLVSTDPTISFGGVFASSNVTAMGGAAATTPGNAATKGGQLGAGGVATGGSVVATGGRAISGTALGGSATGGTSTSAGAASAGNCVPVTCGTHKWACWKMPNPTGSGLPNPASYSSTADVVHDNVTCLDWQRSPPSTTYTNADAVAYCDGLSLGGYDDWRAPTRIEMMSILDWTRSPATDSAFSSASGFHKTGSNWVLVIDKKGAGAGSDSAWAFNLSDGITSNNQSAAKTDRVRCVRGNGNGEGFSDKAVAPPNQYTDLSADEVQDNYTGLIWQRAGDASGLLSWEDAVTYCGQLTLSGASWRLPSVRELATLVDEAQVAPAIDRTAFPNTKYGSKSNNWYWASHRQRGSTTASWGLNFDDGFTGFNAGTSGSWNYWTAAYAKCVR